MAAWGANPVQPGGDWSGRRDSHPRPQPWQGCALPLSYARNHEKAHATNPNGRQDHRRAVHALPQESPIGPQNPVCDIWQAEFLKPRFPYRGNRLKPSSSQDAPAVAWIGQDDHGAPQTTPGWGRVLTALLQPPITSRCVNGAIQIRRGGAGLTEDIGAGLRAAI